MTSDAVLADENSQRIRDLSHAAAELAGLRPVDRDARL
jgi:hypothetical protein